MTEPLTLGIPGELPAAEDVETFQPGPAETGLWKELGPVAAKYGWRSRRWPTQLSNDGPGTITVDALFRAVAEGRWLNITGASEFTAALIRYARSAPTPSTDEIERRLRAYRASQHNDLIGLLGAENVCDVDVQHAALAVAGTSAALNELRRRSKSLMDHTPPHLDVTG